MSTTVLHRAGPLTPRQEEVLLVVVERHIASGQPVGSKHISGEGALDWASSTIRSELHRLEDLGYLKHPHTSAGRVPTEVGYRYYVDELLPRRPLPATGASIMASLGADMVRVEVDQTLRRLADAMSEVTNLMGVVTGPPVASATVRHVEVLLLQPHLVTVVIITSTGDVAKRLIAFDRPVDHGLAEWAAAFLNDRVQGLPVGARSIAARLIDPSLGPAEIGFLEAIAPALIDLPEDRSVYVSGQARVLTDERRGEITEIEGLMRALEERYLLLAVLRGALDDGRTYLRIGSELPTDLSGVSIVAAGYGPPRGNLGAVSLIGPVRMDYALAIVTVREAARALSSYVEDVYG
ncbi:MAG: heat-inducible transcription repressor HrcA [Thermoleophilia bacterium]|nr:heat-inducible transcription repressor HrcA [Thermoleophilia bacterium]